MDCRWKSIEYVEPFRVPMYDMEGNDLSMDCMDLSNYCTDYVVDFCPPLWTVGGIALKMWIHSEFPCRIWNDIL